MRVVISPKAEKELKKLHKIDQIAIAQRIRAVPGGLRVHQEEKLEGFRTIFRIRVGNYRIVYRKSFQEIYIILIAHRKDVYRLLEQLFK